MAFDARQQIEQQLVHLADTRKNLQARYDNEVSHYKSELAGLDEEIASWQALLDQTAPAEKPAAKKAAAKGGK